MSCDFACAKNSPQSIYPSRTLWTVCYTHVGESIGLEQAHILQENKIYRQKVPKCTVVKTFRTLASLWSCIGFKPFIILFSIHLCEFMSKICHFCCRFLKNSKEVEIKPAITLYCVALIVQLWIAFISIEFDEFTFFLLLLLRNKRTANMQ